MDLNKVFALDKAFFVGGSHVAGIFLGSALSKVGVETLFKADADMEGGNQPDPCLAAGRVAGLSARGGAVRAILVPSNWGPNSSGVGCWVLIEDGSVFGDR